MQSTEKKAFDVLVILLGSNLEERSEMLLKTKELLSVFLGEPLNASSVYESPAWGKTDQPDFLNQVVLFESDIDESTLIRLVQWMEEALGRVRHEKWGPRVIDIDILFYGNRRLTTDILSIPHPELHKRAFTLVPLVEVIPSFIHPTFGLSMKEMLMDLGDGHEIRVYEP